MFKRVILSFVVLSSVFSPAVNAELDSLHAGPGVRRPVTRRRVPSPVEIQRHIQAYVSSRRIPVRLESDPAAVRIAGVGKFAPADAVAILQDAYAFSGDRRFLRQAARIRLSAVSCARAHVGAAYALCQSIRNAFVDSCATLSRRPAATAEFNHCLAVRNGLTNQRCSVVSAGPRGSVRAVCVGARAFVRRQDCGFLPNLISKDHCLAFQSALGGANCAGLRGGALDLCQAVLLTDLRGFLAASRRR